MLIEGRDIWGLTTERGVTELLRVEGSCCCSTLAEHGLFLNPGMVS